MEIGIDSVWAYKCVYGPKGKPNSSVKNCVTTHNGARRKYC